MAESHCCPRCHANLSADAPEGLCPECLLQQALAGPGAAPDRDEASRSPAPVFVPPTPAELAPRFPQLEILRLLGQGGMGAVYQARQPKLDRFVAVKILPPEVARDPGFTERFTREARSLARLNHPNIVTIFDFGEADGLYYFTMEYVDGKNVRELMEAQKLDPAVTLKVIPQVCDALHYAHDEGFVHRDIKPENILLDKKGRVKIADFGLARLIGLTPSYLTLTGSQEIMGTLYYMAPEQMKRTHGVDHRADLYSLGVVFYEMLTGELPVGRFAPPSHKARLDARLDAVVMRALAREPELRFQDAAELKHEVESVVTSAAPAPQPVPASQPARSALKGTWPIVRFSISNISWLGAQARGEVYRDAEHLILEFRESNWLGAWSQVKEVRIPFGDITALSLQTETLVKAKRMPRWLRRLGTATLVIKTARSSWLEGLPVGERGRGRLQIHSGDRDAARDLVDSIVERPFHQPDADAQQTPVPASPISAADQLRMQTMPPAIGLLFTGLIAILSCLVWDTFLMHEIWREDSLKGEQVLNLGLSWIGIWCGGYLIAGAIQLMRYRSYGPVIAALVLAMIPWSPAWLLGLPFGIWGMVLLHRREVKAAFAKRGQRGGPAEPESVERKHPAARKVVSFFKSVAGYFLPTFAGHGASRAGAEHHSPQQTIDFVPAGDDPAFPDDSPLHRSPGKG